MASLNPFKNKKKTKTRWYRIFPDQATAENQVPLNQGKALKLEEDDVVVCLARTVEGFFAIQDACPHMGMPLSRGNCNPQGEIVCPWHAYRFDLKTGEKTHGEEGGGAQIYPIRWKEGGLEVGIPQ